MFELTALRFVQHFRGYNPGEIAGFPHDYAAKIVEAGFAVHVPKEADADVDLAARTKSVVKK